MLLDLLNTPQRISASVWSKLQRFFNGSKNRSEYPPSLQRPTFYPASRWPCFSSVQSGKTAPRPSSYAAASPRLSLVIAAIVLEQHPNSVSVTPFCRDICLLPSQSMALFLESVDQQDSSSTFSSCYSVSVPPFGHSCNGSQTAAKFGQHTPL